MIRRALVVAALMAGVGVSVATPAMAVPTPCEVAGALTGGPDAPTPAKPTDGITGSLTDRPFVIAPADADPFAAGSKWTVYETYGFAGLRQNTYDLGCDPLAVSAATLHTGLNNRIIGAATALDAFTSTVEVQAYDPTWLSVFSRLSEVLHDAISDRVFWRYVPIGLVVAAGLLLFTFGRKGDLSGSATAVGWSLLFLTIAAFVLPYPTLVASGAQSTIRAVTSELAAGTTNSGTAQVGSADAAAARVYDAIHYRQWLVRTFGSADSATAKTYGPDLFRAGAMSWADADECGQRPAGDACRQIVEDKATLYKDTAGKVKDSDPAAYLRLQGIDASEGPAISALAATFSVDLFRLLAALVVFVAVAALVVLALAFPVAAPFIMVHVWHGIGVGMLNAAKSAFLKALGFGAVSVLWSMVVQAVLDPTLRLPWVMQVLVLSVLTIALLTALKPWRAIRSMVSFGTGRGGGSVKWLMNKAVDFHLTKKAVHDAGSSLADEKGAAPAPAVAAASAQPAPAPPRMVPMTVDPQPALAATQAPAVPGSPSWAQAPGTPEPAGQSASPAGPGEATRHTQRDGTDVFDVTDLYRRPSPAPPGEPPPLAPAPPVVPDAPRMVTPDGDEVFDVTGMYQRPDDMAGANQ